MRIIDIFEKRANPSLNPKISVNYEIENAISHAPGAIAGVTNCFVSFTKYEKLGINPGSIYSTPIGIYAYPAEYVMATAGKEFSMDRLPFAGTQPYANIFSAKGNIINLVSLSKGEAAKYFKKLIKAFKNEIDSEEIEDFIDQVQTKTLPGAQLWEVTKLVAKAINEEKFPVVWNRVFRAIGIDGCVDTGRKVIHPSEPTQAVFFSISAILNNKRVNNRHSPEEISSRQSRGEESLEINRSLNQILKTQGKDAVIEQIKTLYANSGNWEIINLLSPKFQFLILQSTAIPFLSMNSPSLEVQKYIIDHHPDFIKLRPDKFDSNILFSALITNPKVSPLVADIILSNNSTLISTAPWNSYFVRTFQSNPKEVLQFTRAAMSSVWLSKLVHSTVLKNRQLFNKSELGILNQKVFSPNKLNLV